MVALLFITFAVCLAAGVPVAFSLGISSLVYFVGEGMSLYMFAQRFFAGLNSFTLLCIPGFVFAGSLMNQGGITERLIGFCNKIVGHITGGLSIANVVASMLFAGISGTALADTVSVGGYHDRAFRSEDVCGRSCPRHPDGPGHDFRVLVYLQEAELSESGEACHIERNFVVRQRIVLRYFDDFDYPVQHHGRYRNSY